MPKVRPRTSWLLLADLSQMPSCIRCVFSVRRRASDRISPSTSSTTLRVLENGALKTATPRGRVDEVHLVGADAEAAHREEVLSRVQGTGRHLGVRPDAEQRHAGQGVDQLALTQRPRPGLDLEPLTSQGFRGNRVDVLQQQSFHSSNLRLDLTDRPPDDCPVTLEVGYAGVRRSASGLTARAPRWPWAQSRNGPHWRGGLEFEGARNVCPEGDLSVRYTHPDHRPNLTLGPL